MPRTKHQGHNCAVSSSKTVRQHPRSTVSAGAVRRFCDYSSNSGCAKDEAHRHSGSRSHGRDPRADDALRPGSGRRHQPRQVRLQGQRQRQVEQRTSQRRLAGRGRQRLHRRHRDRCRGPLERRSAGEGRLHGHSRRVHAPQGHRRHRRDRRFTERERGDDRPKRQFGHELLHRSRRAQPDQFRRPAGRAPRQRTQLRTDARARSHRPLARVRHHWHLQFRPR